MGPTGVFAYFSRLEQNMKSIKLPDKHKKRVGEGENEVAASSSAKKSGVFPVFNQFAKPALPRSGNGRPVQPATKVGVGLKNQPERLQPPNRAPVVDRRRIEDGKFVPDASALLSKVKAKPSVPSSAHVLKQSTKDHHHHRREVASSTRRGESNDRGGVDLRTRPGSGSAPAARVQPKIEAEPTWVDSRRSMARGVGASGSRPTPLATGLPARDEPRQADDMASMLRSVCEDFDGPRTFITL
jgi:hypothetical protein